MGITLLLLLFAWQGAEAKETQKSYNERQAFADSIMDKVIFHAPFYEHIIDDYQAMLYIKGAVNVKKKNRLIRYIPSMFRMKKGVNEYIMENLSELHFKAPDIYDQKVKAAVGTSEFWEMDGHLIEYFHINIYSSTLLYDMLLSPLAPNAKSYYTFNLDSIAGEVGNRQFKISFIPKSKSFQLVNGYMVVSENVWSVREISFAGQSELIRFNNYLQMGDVGTPEEFLPLYYMVDATFHFLGNVVDGNYTATLDYKDIKQNKLTDPTPGNRKQETGKSRYDLSDSYTLRSDTNAFLRDTAYFNASRPIPLSSHEETLYEDYFLNEDSTSVKHSKTKHPVFWGQVGDVLVQRYTVNLAQVGSVRCSPIINPFLLSYSGSNGFSYRQEFKYNRLFTGDRLLHIVPQIGYNISRGEFYWSISSNFDYLPQKRTSLHIDVGNGNRIYSSDVLDDLKAIPDSIFDFDQIHLDYFKDLYLRVRHSWEIVNGLTLDVGFSIHRRREAKRSNFVADTSEDSEVSDPFTLAERIEIDPDLLKKFRHTYTSFAPRIRLSWTPGQYYYMNGKRKVNLYSKFPTISVDWERGISGIIHSTGKYERLEIDYQHTLSFGVMRKLYYRIGWGAFTNQKELYFVDFANLARSNLPVGWNDDIGGVFQLLDNRWYNSSRKYVRLNATYEAPFLLLPHLNRYSQYVINERLYMNLLTMPRLHPYVELGYGIGTQIFDFGLFASFANWKYQEVGVKFTFELFNR